MDGADYDLHLHDVTSLALLVSSTGKRKDAVWLPRSRVRSDIDDRAIGSTIELTIPDWLAEREGLA